MTFALMDKIQQSKNEGIQVFRALLFLSIFGAHAINFNPLLSIYIDVTPFFVMSGFLLMFRDKGDDMPCGLKFCFLSMVKRIRRLYPLHVCAAFFCFLIFLRSSSEKIVDLSKGLFFNISLLNPWIPKYAVSLNGPAWYLGVAAFLYFSFPFVRWVIVKSTMTGRWLIIALLFLLRILWAGVAIKVAPYDFEFFRPFGIELWSWYFLPLARLADFWIGCFAGIFYREYKEKLNVSNFFSFLLQIATLALGVCLFKTRFDNYPFLAKCFFVSNIMRSALSVLWCYFFIEGKGFLRFLIVRPLVALGNISGYCYLIHAPVLLAPCVIPSFLKLDFSKLWGGRYLVALIELLATIILSVLWVELNKRIAKRGTPAADKASGESQETPRS